jgi:ethanolamine ammonia-lyase large subunit
MYRTTVSGERFVFADLRELLAKANEEKSGDQLAGIAAGSVTERVAAKMALSDVSLAEITGTALIDDDVTELIAARHDPVALAPYVSLTVGEFRELVLSDEFPQLWEAGLQDAITPELAAATAKLMGNKDLALAAAPLRVVTRCRNTLGEKGIFGVRVQPNHPTDDLEGILLSALDGLLYGCGDAVIGVNPARESVESTARLLHGLDALIRQLGLPTQACVLAHITTQLAALERGAPVDLLFQSVAGTQEANRSFGVDLKLLADGREQVLRSHQSRDGDFIGEQVMYFETGQGSALSADAAWRVDQLTLEARAHAVAKAYDPFLLNSVVGFIGPEYLADHRQIIRAGLEDHFVGKLQGLPMGVDVCYTNHVDADANSNDDLLILLAAAGCNYVMGVPGSDDVMLNYQSTSYHDAAGVRQLLGLHPAPEFEAWLEQVGITRAGRLLPTSVGLPASLGARLTSALEHATRPEELPA